MNSRLCNCIFLTLLLPLPAKHWLQSDRGLGSRGAASQQGHGARPREAADLGGHRHSRSEAGLACDILARRRALREDALAPSDVDLRGARARAPGCVRRKEELKDQSRKQHDTSIKYCTWTAVRKWRRSIIKWKGIIDMALLVIPILSRITAVYIPCDNDQNLDLHIATEGGE